jgi:Domain of unknown function (DUF2017)
VLRRRRIKRTHTGSFRLGIGDDERELLRQLLPQLRELITAAPGPHDDRVRRLFPTAYAQDPEHDAEYHRLMRDELVASRVAAIDQVEASLEATELTEAELLGWIRSVNAVRLVLGTMLDVSEDAEPEPVAADDPDLPNLALYGYLSGLLDEMVTVLDD